MQVAITSRHGNISDRTREHITQKAEKLVTYFERVTAIEVTIEFEKDRVKAEILVDAEHKHNFVASDEGERVTSTFDRSLQKMEQQIRRYKDKIQDRRRDLPVNHVPNETGADTTAADATEADTTEATD